MNFRSILVIAVVTLFVASILCSYAAAQSRREREPEFADQVNTAFTRAAAKPNQQKFFSILIFVVLGGAGTYAIMRGIRKVASVE